MLYVIRSVNTYKITKLCALSKRVHVLHICDCECVHIHGSMSIYHRCKRTHLRIKTGKAVLFPRV